MLHTAPPTFGPPLPSPSRDRILLFFVAIAIVTMLYVARDVFVPVAIAVLLSFVLAPVILVLRKVKVPRTPAVVTVVVLTFVGLLMLGGVLALQITNLASELPRYRVNMQEKIKSIRDATGGSGALVNTIDMLQDLSRELDAESGGQKDLASGAAEGRPVPVEVREPPPGLLGTISALMAPLLHPLAIVGIVFIFVLFILLQREDLRNRFIRLAGAHDIQRTTAALDDAASRLSRFFLAQVALNAAFGSVIGLGLWAIGVPSPFLWGLAAAVLRFVPYIGAAVAAALPIGLALAVDPGWSMVLATVALFLVVEPIVGHVVEPLLYGRSTGLSPVAVIAAATFWTWLWGPIGLLLSTPLTLCLVVIGRHVESLEFLDVALGDRPPLSDSELLYQRLLAGDPLEAAATAEECLKEKSIAAYCDEVALPALRLAQRDAARGALEESRQTRVRETLEDMLEHLPEPDEPPSAEAPSVLVLAARSPLDEAAGILLVHVLSFEGIAAQARPTPMRHRAAEGLAGGATVVLSYLSPATSAHRRYLSRRVLREAPGAALVVADWMAEPQGTPDSNGPVIASMAAAAAAVREAVPESPSPALAPAV